MCRAPYDVCQVSATRATTAPKIAVQRQQRRTPSSAMVRVPSNHPSFTTMAFMAAGALLCRWLCELGQEPTRLYQCRHQSTAVFRDSVC
jgi:hypothetical protein